MNMFQISFFDDCPGFDRVLAERLRGLLSVLRRSTAILCPVTFEQHVCAGD